MAMSDWPRYSWNNNLIKNVEKCLFLWVSPMLLITKECTSHVRRWTINENEHSKETKTLIFYSYLFRQSFQVWRCKLGIAIFAWRVTWNYAYSPLNPIRQGGGAIWHPPIVFCYNSKSISSRELKFSSFSN